MSTHENRTQDLLQDLWNTQVPDTDFHHHIHRFLWCTHLLKNISTCSSHIHRKINLFCLHSGTHHTNLSMGRIGCCCHKPIHLKVLGYFCFIPILTFGSFLPCWITNSSKVILLKNKVYLPFGNFSLANFVLWNSFSSDPSLRQCISPL